VVIHCRSKELSPFLMDTVSTHNFISCKWIKLLGLKIQLIKDFSVMVSSDKKLLMITWKCEQINLEI